MLLLVIPDMPLNCHNCFQWNRPYSCEALDYDRKQLQKLNVCWNNVYRKVFRMQWESVKELQLLCGRLDFTFIYFIYFTYIF